MVSLRPPSMLNRETVRLGTFAALPFSERDFDAEVVGGDQDPGVGHAVVPLGTHDDVIFERQTHGVCGLHDRCSQLDILLGWRDWPGRMVVGDPETIRLRPAGR